MAIDSLYVGQGDAIYYTDEFRDVIEDHLSWLRNHQKTTLRAILPEIAYPNAGDFYSVLDAIGLKRQYHWTVLRMNGLTDPIQSPEDLSEILLPSTDIIDNLVRLQLNRK